MEPISQSSDADAQDMQALGREVGRRSVERLGSGLTRLVEESSALYRWALTMLVLLNVGGLYLSVVARESVGADMFPQIALTFFGGVMMALLAALVGLALTVPMAGSMRRALTDWTDVSMSGALSEEAMESARRVRRMGTLWLAAMSIVGLMSLAFFAAGSLILGERLGIVGPPGQVEAMTESPEAVVPVNASEPVASETSEAPNAAAAAAAAEATKVRASAAISVSPSAAPARSTSPAPATRPAQAASRPTSPQQRQQQSTPARAQREASPAARATSPASSSSPSTGSPAVAEPAPQPVQAQPSPAAAPILSLPVSSNAE